MKHIRVAAHPDPEHAPPFLEHLLVSPNVVEGRAIDWNRGDSEISTHLYAIDGDAETFESSASETPGVESISVSAMNEPVSYVLLELRDASIPIFGRAADAIDRAGLVVRRPLVYRDETIHGHIVGDPETLQDTLDTLPGSVEIEIQAITDFPSARVNPATELSERQQEAIQTALDMGYYDTPRAVTHTDIAAELGCASNTASEHLQKGETKLVRAGMDVFGANR